MRLFLVLLALLSGLSLAEVTASSARAQVVGAAAGTIVSASEDSKTIAALAKPQRPVCTQRAIRAILLPVVALGRTISIVICDRPLE